MLSRLLGWLSRLHTIRVATTRDEREAIYRQRYRIYVEELGHEHPHADAERGMIVDPDDEAAGATLLYAGRGDEVSASLRLTVWELGAVPPAKADPYSMDRFPALDDRQCAEANYLMVERSLRSSSLLVALTSRAVDFAIRDHGVELLFADCQPGLLPAYGRLGLRPYGGRPIPFGAGLLLPVVGICGDLGHARAVGSPWMPVLSRLDRDGRLPSRNIEPLLGAIRGAPGIETEPGRIASILDDIAPSTPDRFLGRLDPAARRTLSRGSFVLGVEPGMTVVRENVHDREIFVILEGAYAVSSGGVALGTLRPGELFGELAFLVNAGRRTATVTATTAGRVLVVRRRFLQELKRDDPRAALSLFEEIAGAIAARLQEKTAPPSP